MAARASLPPIPIPQKYGEGDTYSLYGSIHTPRTPNTPTANVNLPRREDLQPSYAQTLTEGDQSNHGWYASMINLRKATEEDIDDITKIAVQAFPDDPQWNYRFPSRGKYSADKINSVLNRLGGFAPAGVFALLSQLITRVGAEETLNLSLIDAAANLEDPSSERGASFHKSVPELRDKLFNDWVELLKTFADQNVMDWSKCAALSIFLVLAYWILRCLLCRRSRQSFGWTMLTFVLALVIVYFEDESDLSAPMKFIVWLFSISLSLTYIRPDVALRTLNGIHTLLIASIGLLLATAISWISQVIGSGGSISLGAAFALGLPTSSFTWRAVVYQTAWGERIDNLILGLDVMDVLAYAGSRLPGWVTWIAQQISAFRGQDAGTTPLDSVVVDGTGAGGAGDESRGSDEANGELAEASDEQVDNVPS